MMDVLSDTREVLRNDSLILLYKVTKGNANLQKIVAFENAFDRLFEIIEAEGWTFLESWHSHIGLHVCNIMPATILGSWHRQ